MEWWRGVTRSRCHVWRSDETKWAGIIINTLPSPLHSRYTTEYHRNLGICWGLLDTTDNTKRRSVDISVDASYLCRYILHEQLCIMRFCIEGFGIRKIRFRQVETALNLFICWVDSRYISLLSTSRYLSLLSMSRYVDISRCWVATLQLSADQWVVSGCCSPECEYLDNECGHCGHGRHGDVGQPSDWWPVSPSSRTISPPLITPATIHLTAPSHCHYHFSSHLIGGNSESDEYTQSSNGFESRLNEYLLLWIQSQRKMFEIIEACVCIVYCIVCVVYRCGGEGWKP